MDLYILRHGKAEAIGPLYRSDYERPLSAKGRKGTKRSAEGMKAMNVQVDEIISSPLLRARQTAEIVQERLAPETEIEISDALATHDLSEIAALIQSRSTNRSVMLIGHEPTLSMLISMLASGTTQAALDLKPGSLCKLVVGHGPVRLAQCATVSWLLTPKQLGAIR